MAAPSFVQAGTGATDATGAWTYTAAVPSAVGNIVIFQVLQDGSTAEAVNIISASNISALDGTTPSVSVVVWNAPVGSPTAALQHLYIGRATSTSAAPFLSGSNSTSEDVYVRSYEFTNVSTGTTLATVIENGTAGATVNEANTSPTAADANVTTLGSDRLACNFVAVNDDNAISEFTGQTGGTWVEVAEYAEASGTDGAIQLQYAYAYTLEYLAASASETIWGVSGQTQVAQSFVAPSTGSTWRVASVLRVLGSPVDDVVFEIHADSSGAPSGTALGSGTVDITSTTGGVYSASISAALTASSTYWLVMKRSGSLDDINRYVTKLSQNAYAGGSGATYNGSSWTTGLTDHTFGVIAGDGSGTINGGSGSIVDSDAWGVVGFALIGTTVSAAAYQPRHGFVNFQDPGVF